MYVSEAFKGWVAGFLDGDGSIGIHKQRPNRKQGLVHTAFYVATQFTNTDKRALEAVNRVYGGHVPAPHRSEWGNYPNYQLTVASNQAARLFRDIYPYLVLKREQAALCLELVD